MVLAFVLKLFVCNSFSKPQKKNIFAHFYHVTYALKSLAIILYLKSQSIELKYNSFLSIFTIQQNNTNGGL